MRTSLIMCLSLILGALNFSYAGNVPEVGEIIWNKIDASDFKVSNDGKKILQLKKKLRLGKRSGNQLLGLYFKVNGVGTLRVTVKGQGGTNIVSPRDLMVNTQGAQRIMGVAFDNLILSSEMKIKLTLRDTQHTQLQLNRIAVTFPGSSENNGTIIGQCEQENETIRTCERRVRKLQKQVNNVKKGGSSKEKQISFIGFSGNSCNWNFKVGDPGLLSGSIFTDGDTCASLAANVSTNLQSVVTKVGEQETCINVKETDFLNICTAISEGRLEQYYLPGITAYRSDKSIKDEDVLVSIDLSKKSQSCEVFAAAIKQSREDVQSIRVNGGAAIGIFNIGYSETDKIIKMCKEVALTGTYSDGYDASNEYLRTKITVYKSDKSSDESNVITSQAVVNNKKSCETFVSNIQNMKENIKGIQVNDGTFMDIVNITHSDSAKVLSFCENIAEVGEYVNNYKPSGTTHSLDLYYSDSKKSDYIAGDPSLSVNEYLEEKCSKLADTVESKNKSVWGIAINGSFKDIKDISFHERSKIISMCESVARNGYFYN